MYFDDLAWVHASGFGDFARRAAPSLLAQFRRAGLEGGTLVDLGCGAGEWLQAARLRGYRVVGVDQSKALVRMARKRAPGASLTVGSVYEFVVPPCDAVTALGEVLSYLPAPSPRRLFRRVHAALRPGGLFVFDVIVSSRARPFDYRTWRSGEDWTVLVEVSEKRGRLTRAITTFRRVGARYRRAHEVHHQRVLERATILETLRQVGFAVRTSRRYGDLRLPPRRLAFFARKRPEPESEASKPPHSEPPARPAGRPGSSRWGEHPPVAPKGRAPAELGQKAQSFGYDDPTYRRHEPVI